MPVAQDSTTSLVLLKGFSYKLPQRLRFKAQERHRASEQSPPETRMFQYGCC